MKAASAPLADDLQALLGCPREELVFHVPTDHYVMDEGLVSGPPFVEVAWFDRGLEAQDAVARILTDRLREAGQELYQWLEAGAHFYVCGDANKMAKDVQEALLDVIAEHGHKSREEAEEYLSELRRAKRYQRDVY